MMIVIAFTGLSKKIYKKTFNKDLDEDYSVEEQLGSGSIGQVYKVKNKTKNMIF